MSEVRNKVRRVIYAIGAIIIAVILLRFFLKLFGVSDTNAFIKIIYDFSNIFVSPFAKIIDDQGGFEFTSIIALMMWLAFILIFTELVASFLHERFSEIVANLIDAIFKFIELFLLIRLVTQALGINYGRNDFLNWLINTSAFVHEPFVDIGIQPIDLPTGQLEITTLVALIIVIVIDVVTNGIVNSVIPEQPEGTPKTVAPAPQIVNNVPGQNPGNTQVNVYMPAGTPAPVVTRTNNNAGNSPPVEVSVEKRRRWFGR